MTLTKTLTLATAGIFVAASAHAAGDFAFDYHLDRDSLSTPAGAEKVLEDLENRIEAECGYSTLTQRLPYVRRMTEQCVTETLEGAVDQIDAPQLDAAFEAWQENRA